MKILVDRLPSTCGECEYCADAMTVSALGVPKPINVCVLKSLIPPKSQDEVPEVNKELQPYKNDCPCFDGIGGGLPEVEKVKSALNKPGESIKKSSIILD